MPHSSGSTATGKPRKPHPDFPLFPHRTGRWAKKVRGNFCYFGKVADDPEGEAALNLWLAQKDDLLAGRKPRARGEDEGLRVRDLVNEFLTAKRHLVDTRELSIRSFRDYYATCDRIIAAFGRSRLVSDLGADDFIALRAAAAKTRGVVALGNEIGRVRVVFNYGYNAGLIDRPVRFGPTFKKPSRKALRQSRQANGPRMFEAAELVQILAALQGKPVAVEGKDKPVKRAANPSLRAMVLLGLNCGFGQTDVSSLPLSALDLKGGWIDFPRPKTGVARRCPLWKETVQALRLVVANRPTPKLSEDAGLVFITKYGNRWTRANKDGMSIDPVGMMFSRVLTDLDLNRDRLNFYTLRRVFETIGGESKDQVAVDHIMGHAPPDDDMSARYRERVSEERLRAVADTVRKWLFARPKKRRAK